MPRKPANPKNDTTAKKPIRRKKTAEPVAEAPAVETIKEAVAETASVKEVPEPKKRGRKPKVAEAAVEAVADTVADAPVKKTRGRNAKVEAPAKKTRGRKAKTEAPAETIADTVAAESPVKKTRGRKAKTETPADAPAKKPRGRKKAAPDIVAETLPPVAAETAVEDASVNIQPDIVVDVADEPLPGQLSFDGEETPAPAAKAPAKKTRKPRAKKTDVPKRRGRPPKAKAPELVLTTTLQIGETELDISGIAEKAYKEYKRVHKRKIVTDFHVYVKPDEGAAYFTVNGEGSDDFKVDLT